MPYGRRALRTTAERRIATGGKIIATEPRKRGPGQVRTSECATTMAQSGHALLDVRGHEHAREEK